MITIKRTDPNLEPILEDDYKILIGMATKLFTRFRKFKYHISREDLLQDICEYYCEALVKYPLKPRTIQKRPFVFNYINFKLKIMYQPHYKFVNKDVFPRDIIINPEDQIDESEHPTMEQNPYMFECSYDLQRALDKYTLEERIIIYYKYFVGIPVKDLHFYLPSKKPVTHLLMKQLLIRLKTDQDLIELLKEN